MSGKRIVLLQPPKPAFGAAAEESWEITKPFALHYLAAALEEAPDVEVRIVDLEQRALAGLPEGEVLNSPADLFGVTATTFTRFEALRLVREIRSRHPGAVIVVGGVHFSHCADDTLRNVTEVDAVVRGEGELVLKEFVGRLKEKEAWGNIAGLSSRRGQEVAAGPNQCAWIDLDELPLFEDFLPEDYPESLMGYPEKMPAFSIMTSRGCPYRCIFCSKSHTRYRLRDPQRVVDEILALRDRLGVKAANFLDLTFTANRTHVTGLCDELVRRRAGIVWWCESRANIRLELLEAMSRAGCVSVALGVESGSPRVLSSIQKDIKLQQVEEFCRRAMDCGMIVTAYFMYSHPGELPEDVELTLDFIERLQDMGVSIGGLQPAMIFPGSGLEPLARAAGGLPPDFSWTTPYESELNRKLGQLPNVPLFLDRLNPEDLLRFQEEYLRRLDTRGAAKVAVGLNWRELTAKAVRAFREGRPAARLLWSPRFYRMWSAEVRRKNREKDIK